MTFEGQNAILKKTDYGEISMKTVSVISTTYCKEKPENLDECLHSVFSQTVMPDRVVLVGDGKLPEDMYAVIERYSEKYGEVFTYDETAENNGNWYASNRAIELCDTDIIAKIDSDDILLEGYIGRIKAVFEENAIDICGVYIEEFDDGTGEKMSVRKTPVSHSDILTYARRRNPFNNPGIAFSRELAGKIGAYREMKRCEDYDFAVRMLLNGARGMNIPEVLVRYRTSRENIVRRKNFDNTKWFIISRWRIYRMGFCSFSDFFITSAAQLFLFVMPVGLTGRFYERLRK